jgi:hypothetical protein
VLESSHNILLEKEEKTWRLKSQALWLQVGDNNTKFFHQYANFRKKLNTIWEIKASNGSMVSYFNDKAKKGA